MKKKHDFEKTIIFRYRHEVLKSFVLLWHFSSLKKSKLSLKTEHCCDVRTSTWCCWLKRYEDDKNVIVTLLTVFKNIDWDHYFSVNHRRKLFLWNCAREWAGMLNDRNTVMYSYTCCFDYLTRDVLKSQESKNKSAVKWKQHATLIWSRVHEWLVVSLHVLILAAQIWGILWDHVQMDLFFCFLCVHQPTRDRESAQLAASTYRPYENSIESEYQWYDIGGVLNQNAQIISIYSALKGKGTAF